MGDFIRPELKAAVWRWRDVIVAVAIAGLGAWLILGGRGFLPWLGWVFLALGAVLLLAGLQRTRFRQGDDGPGVVQIRERRLAYFGPLDGGVVDIAGIRALAFEPKGHPAPYWVITGSEHRDIAIPVTAKGAEALFDTFSSLPGMRTERLLAVLEDPPDQRVVIWSRPGALLH